MNYTKGKLEYIGTTSIVTTETKGSRRLSIAIVLTEAVDIDTNCKYSVDFKANAAELVRRWNSQPDLVKACERMLGAMRCDELNFGRVFDDDLRREVKECANQAIAKAQSKTSVINQISEP